MNDSPENQDFEAPSPDRIDLTEPIAWNAPEGVQIQRGKLWYVFFVIMLIWGGIRYTTSAGDSNKVTAAKNTVLYAIVGLVVAILAYAIVNMVIGKITSG